MRTFFLTISILAAACGYSLLEAHEQKSASPVVEVSNLFVLYDTGETQFLTPVISKLDKEGKDYRILVMGTAAEVIKNAHLPEDKVISLESLGIEKVVDKTTSRFEELSQRELEMIHSQIKTNNLVIGFASIIQKQLAIEYASDAHTFMVWDNFVATNPEGGDAFKVAHEIQHVVDKVLYPSNYVAVNMQNRPYNFEVVGHPSLQTFCEEFAAIDQSEIREKLALSPDQKVRAYLGGWCGDEDYQKGFELFVSCIVDNPFEDDLFIIQPHPKSGDGKFERELLEFYGVTNFLIPPEKTVNTQEVVAISTGPVMCHKSTVGIKVAALGKDVIHILPEEDEYSNALIDAEVAPCVATADELNQLLLAPSLEERTQDLYTLMMMPKDATDQVYSQIVDSKHSWRNSA